MTRIAYDSQASILSDIKRSFSIESIPDPVVAVDTQFNIILWNKAAEKFYGWTKEEVLGKNSNLFLKSRLLDTTVDQYRKQIRLTGLWHGEVVHNKKNGSRVYVLTSTCAVRNRREAVVGYISFHKDINKHKQVENNLRFISLATKELASSLNVEKTLKKVAELAVPRIADWCSVDLLTPQNTIEQVALSHKDPEKIKWAELLRKKDPPDLTRNYGIAKVIKTGQPEFQPYIPDEILAEKVNDPKVFKILKKIGFTSAIIVPIIAQNKVLGTITLTNTESRRSFTPFDLEIAQKLASSTSLAIENARLYENLRALEQRKDDFISIASHELKTPITSLKIYTDLFKKQLHVHQNADYNKVLTSIDTQINKLHMLVGDLLNISRIQAGKLELRLAPFNLHELIYEIIEQIQPTTKQHIIYDSKLKSVMVKGDKDRIGQVLINLFTNAIKYSPKGKEINISLTTSKGCAEVSVRDYGIGIPKEHQEKIFERFYRVGEQNGDTAFPGLGMGLYISKEIIARHDGNLWVEQPKSGKGSLFIFRIPCLKYVKKNSRTRR